MTDTRHKADTKSFGEMTRMEQVRSLNATICYLERALRCHLNKMDDEAEAKRVVSVRMAQIKRLVNRLAQEHLQP